MILEQWVDYITEWSNYTEDQIGIIQGSDNIDISKNIIIATIQTLDNIPEISNILAEEISFIIVDECHCAAASTFQKTLYNFKPKYLLGLSATLERDDDMTFLITHAIGETYFVADRQKMVDQGLLIKPDLRPIFMKRKNFYNESGNKNNINKYYRETLNDFKNDKMVIKFISELAAHHKKQGDQILMIIKEEEYSEKFYEMLLKRLIFTQDQIEDFKKQADKINEEKLQKAIYRKTNQIKNQIVPKVNEIKKKYRTANKTKFSCVTSHEHNQMKKSIEKETKKIEIVKVEWYELPEVEDSSRIAWILGKTKKTRRKQIIEKAKNKEIDIIITTKLFDKAIKQMWHFTVM